ncbi:hypothetical protein [Rhodococcus gannanensis]|uniref:Uncharacterized protein n=1 Tax=Rhodococcus gannanensis TaxID=1960308 RepID=A0ABW4P8H6_9NOCA
MGSSEIATIVTAVATILTVVEKLSTASSAGEETAPTATLSVQ